MERSSAQRASRTTLGLLVAGPLLAVLVVTRALPAADLSEAGLAWAPDALAAMLVALAAVASLAWLVAGLRSGQLSELLMAGASAAVAGGGLSLLASATIVVPAIVASLALLAAGLSDRSRISIPGGQGTRIGAAVAIIGFAEIAVLAELLPGLDGAVVPTEPLVAGVGVAIAILAALAGTGHPAAPVASAVLVGVAAASLARSGGIETVVGLTALVGSQVIAIVTRFEPSAEGTPAGGREPADPLPEFAGRLADAILRFDGGLRLRDWNATATVLLGLDHASSGTRLEDLLGIPISALPRDDGSIATAIGVADLSISLQRSGRGLTAIVRDPGASPDAERLGRELRGTIEELLQARRTIELQRQEIERSSAVDPLTGVASRTAILDRLRIEVAQARRYLHPVGVVLVDIDGFGELNRGHGTTGGDAILREVALRIRLRVREADELGRIGSDSFMMVLPHTEESGAATLADAIQHRLGLRPVTVGDTELRVTVSVGVAVMRAGEELDVDGLMARAEEALAAAQQAGGDHITLDRRHGPVPVRLEDHRPTRLGPAGRADEGDA